MKNFADIYLVNPDDDPDPKPDKPGFFKSVQVGTNLEGKPIFVDFKSEVTYDNYINNISGFKSKVDIYYNLWSNNNSYLLELKKLGNNEFSNYNPESRSFTNPDNLDEKRKKIENYSNFVNKYFSLFFK